MIKIKFEEIFFIENVKKEENKKGRYASERFCNARALINHNLFGRLSVDLISRQPYSSYRPNLAFPVMYYILYARIGQNVRDCYTNRFHDVVCTHRRPLGITIPH